MTDDAAASGSAAHPTERTLPRAVASWLGVARLGIAGSIRGRSRREVLWLALAVGSPAVLLALLLLFVDLKTEGTAAFRDPGWDRHLYLAMARGGALDFHLAPYCWRVLVPLLAAAMPGPMQPGFMILCFASICGFGVALLWLYRSAGFSRPLALTGLLLVFSLGWGVKFIVADFWIPDGTAFLCVALALALCVRNRPVHFAIVLAAGALVKESVLFTLPLFYTLNARRPLDGRLALKTVAAGLPALVLLVVLRITIAEQNSDGDYIATLPEQISRFPELFPPYHYPSLYRHIFYEQRWVHRDFDAMLDMSVRSYGLLVPLLAFAALPRHWRMGLRLLPLLVLAFLQLLFATDTQRLLVLAAPVAVWMALLGARDLAARAGVRPEALVILAGMLFALLLTAPDTYQVPAAPQAAVIAAWAAAVGAFLAVRRWRARRLPASSGEGAA